MNEEKIQNQNEQRGNNLTEMLKSMGVSENDIEEIVSSVLSDTEEEEKDEQLKFEEPKTEEIKTEKKKYAGIFDDVEKLEEAYKNLQAEYTRERQKFKPFEQFIDLLNSNPEFAKYILEKSQEFFFKDRKSETKSEKDEFEFEEFGKEEKSSYNKDEILSLIRQEVSQVLTAQKMLDDFRKNHPEVTDEELVNIINHAKTHGGDLETSYMILYKDKFKEELKRQVLSELKGHLKSGQSQQMTKSVEKPKETQVLNEEDYWKLAIEVARNPEKLKEIDAKTKAILFNILARQIL